MKLPSLLTSEAFGVVINYAITGVATVCGLAPVMSMALGEGSAALLKDGKEAQQDKAIAIAEAVGAGAAKAFPVYQALPVKDQIGLMEGLAQVDDPQDLVNASFVQAELAKLPNSQVRKEAESYVRALPDHVRRTLASQGDPAGRTATAQSIPKNAQEFGAAFAAIPSIYKAGDAVPHMPGWVLDAQIVGGGFGEVWRARQREMLCAVKFCKGGTSATSAHHRLRHWGRAGSEHRGGLPGLHAESRLRLSQVCAPGAIAGRPAASARGHSRPWYHPAATHRWRLERGPARWPHSARFVAGRTPGGLA
jgi:hypothetical protein